jgi:hypothetical protein
MKTHQKHNKIGSIYAAALTIGLTPEKAKNLLRIESASELREQWDYRALGMKIAEARAALATVATRKSYHHRKPGNYRPYHFCPQILAYLKKKKARDTMRESNLKKIAVLPAAQSLEEMKQYTNGYECGYGCVTTLEESFLVIERNEAVTWSDKKSWKWPTSRHTTYSLTLISAAGDTIANASLDNRKGDWLEKIGIALGLATGARTPISQTAAMIPVREINKLDLTITELRLFGTGFAIYCAKKENIHFHGKSKREAIRGLFRKMRARDQKLLDDTALVTLKMAEKFGFCQIGINEFLSELGWCDRKSATAGEVRLAIQNIDVSPWVSELAAIGIIKNHD